MSPETEQRVVAFVRALADRCKTCLRRNEATCRSCVSRSAASIMADINAGSLFRKSDIDYSYATRVARVVGILERANRPLLSHEIDLGGTCSVQLKHWTLSRLLKLKRICRKASRSGNGKRKVYLYSLPKKGKPCVSH